ncbi:hypothetical protein GCM10009785_28040 [Brooklawnia cerclae]
MQSLRSLAEVPDRVDTPQDVAASVRIVCFSDIGQRFGIAENVEGLLDPTSPAAG